MPRPAGQRAQAQDEALIDAFLHMMRAESGTSFNTISAYGSDLRELSRFLAERDLCFVGCERPDLEAFFASRAAEGLSSNSAARKLSCLKRFTRFLTAEGKRQSDPALLIDGAKARRRLPHTLSAGEVELLLDAAHEAAAKAPEAAAAARAPASLAFWNCSMRRACASRSWLACPRPRSRATSSC